MTPQPEPPAPQPPRISVVVVSFERVEQLRRSLELLGAGLATPGKELATPGLQIMVVDNASTDGAALLDDQFPSVRYNRLPKNFGLTRALNIGLRAAEGEYILCLHDDTALTAEAAQQLADILEARSDLGAVAPFLTDASGNAVPQVRALPTPADPDPQLQLPSGDAETVVECVSGAAIMFRAFFLRALRQVDERYGTYGSAIEICAQLRRAGKKVAVVRSVSAIHEGPESVMEQKALEGDRAAGTSAFLGKHHGAMNGFLYRMKTALGALVTFHFSKLAGALTGQKIDGTG